MRDSIYNSKECMERAMYELMIMENEFAKLNIKYGCHKVKEIMKSTCCSIFEVENCIKREKLFQAELDKIDNMINNGVLIKPKSLDVLSEETNSSQFLFNTDRITQLKSQLKYCKNHMQRLNIERELNKLYKNKER